MDQSFNKIVIIILLVFVFIAAGAALYPHIDFLNRDTVEKQILLHQNANEQTPFLIVNKGIVFRTKIVDTEEERAKGLSGTLLLADDEGMLFVFQDLGYYQMWMKGMLFSLDIVWLDQDFTVVDIKKNLKPDTYPETFGPRTKAKYVLELNAGIADKYGFVVGDNWKIVDKNDL